MKAAPKVIALLFVGAVVSAPLPLTAPNGDLNLDDKVDALDLQCEVLVFDFLVQAGVIHGDQCSGDGDCVDGAYCRKEFSEYKICLPSCLDPDVSLGPNPDVVCDDPAAETETCAGMTHKKNADFNCDGKIGNEDLTFLVAISVAKLGWPGTPDMDGDNKLNACDEDSDGDGLLDELETEVDTDEDGDPDYLDLDSDDDGVGDDTDCAPLDPADTSEAVGPWVDENGDGIKDACAGPPPAACLNALPDPETGQKCPLYAPCTLYEDCGIEMECHYWYCNLSGTCEIMATSHCWTDNGGGCSADIVFTQQVDPPVDKEFLTPDGGDFRELAALAFTVKNNSGQDWYLDELQLQLETADGASKYDVDAVKLRDDSGGTEFGSGDMYISLQADPFSFPANGKMSSLSNWNTRVPKNGGTNRFLLTLVFPGDATWIDGRSYALKIANTSGIKFKSSSIGGDDFTGSMCGIPESGFVGPWLTAADLVADTDGDGVPDDEDCDPTDPDVGGGEGEICDGKDNDCNDQVDEGEGLCDDGNACTADTCGQEGCEYASLAGQPCDDGDPKTTDEECSGDLCSGLPDLDQDGVADSGYPSTCTGGASSQCNDNCLDYANTDQADANSNGQGDACEGPVGPACAGQPPNPDTGQKCPIFMECSDNSDCGVFQDCQQWWCNGGKCELNALSNCWDDVGGGCYANMVFTQHVSPPVEKDFLAPDGVNFREVASIAFTVKNNSSKDWYLEQITLQLETASGGSKYDVAAVKLFDDSGGTEHNNGDMYVCLTSDPFSFPANGKMSNCASWNSKISKNGGSNRFLINLAFAKEKTYIGGRSYRLKIANASAFKFESSTWGGDVFNGTTCGVPAQGFVGAWVNAKDP